MKQLLFTLAGLPLSTLIWGFLGVGVVTTVLYVLRLRRRPVSVAFLGLWERSLLERKASALRSRLQRLVSLLISLLLVGALVFALGDPRPDEELKGGRSIAVLLDVSASMGEPTGDGTRLEVAKRKISKWFPTLGPADEMLLIELGARPRPLGAATSDAGTLMEALDGAAVLDVSADLEAGLRLASDALRGRERARIVLVSDGALPDIDPESLQDLPPLFFEGVAEKKEEVADNVGITSFAARRYPLSADRFEVLVQVANSSDRPAVVELGLYEADSKGDKAQQLDLHRMTIPPTGTVEQSYDNLDQAESGLIAELTRVDGVDDPFRRDNTARTLLSRRTVARVLVVGQPNNFLDAALLLDESIEVRRVTAEEYPPGGSYDLTIFDETFPQRVAATGAALYFGVPDEGGSYPVELGEELSMFGFDTWKEDSTVFRLIDPYDIQILTGHALLPQEGDVTLGKSQGKPIFVAGERKEGRFLALGFSPRQSDFVLRTAFPLFVLNAIDELHPRGRSDAVVALKTGTLWRPAVSTGEATVQIRGPMSQEPPPTRTVPVDAGRAVLFGERAGFYEALGGQEPERFAASILDGSEGRLPPNDEYRYGDRSAPQVEDMEPRAHRKPWFWLLVGVLCVSFAEWWSYHRRWTV